MLRQLLDLLLAPVGLRAVRAEVLENINALNGNQTLLPHVWGHKMYVDPSDAGLPLWRLGGRSPAGTEDDIFVQNIKPGQRVLDVGANVGLYTLLFAKLVGPTGSVIAFEPGPVSCGLLRRNVAINGYNIVTVENAAVSDRSGEVDLFVCRTGESDNRIAGTLVDHDARDRMRVRCVTLDECVTEPVDFIKIDVQGAEFLVLRGAEKTLRSNPN